MAFQGAGCVWHIAVTCPRTLPWLPAQCPWLLMPCDQHVCTPCFLAQAHSVAVATAGGGAVPWQYACSLTLVRNPPAPPRAPRHTHIPHTSIPHIPQYHTYLIPRASSFYPKLQKATRSLSSMTWCTRAAGGRHWTACWRRTTSQSSRAGCAPHLAR